MAADQDMFLTMPSFAPFACFMRAFLNCRLLPRPLPATGRRHRMVFGRVGAGARARGSAGRGRAEGVADLDEAVSRLFAALGGDVRGVLGAAAEVLDALAAEGLDRPLVLKSLRDCPPGDRFRAGFPADSLRRAGSRERLAAPRVLRRRSDAGDRSRLDRGRSDRAGQLQRGRRRRPA